MDIDAFDDVVVSLISLMDIGRLRKSRIEWNRITILGEQQFHCKSSYCSIFFIVDWNKIFFVLLYSTTIRDKIIPHAVSWFTGEAVDDDDLDVEEDDDDDDDDDGDVDEDEDGNEDDDEEEEEDNDEGKRSRKKV